VSDAAYRAPRTQVIRCDHPAVATGTSKEDPIGRADGAGFLNRVRFVPQAGITGVNTNTRRIDIVNRGQSGAGSTVIATLQFNSGTNGTAFDELAIPVTDANDTMADGDIISINSVAVGTGLADPGGLVILEIDRQD
jgi:hypothetical protein